jgi:hypothetical protein
MSIPNYQWTYLIVDLEDGTTVGTDDDNVAKEFARSETSVVLDIKRCIELQTDDDRNEFTANNIPAQNLFHF